MDELAELNVVRILAVASCDHGVKHMRDLVMLGHPSRESTLKRRGAKAQSRQEIIHVECPVCKKESATDIHG